ncbi:phosphatase PAP2 family protein [Streptomyces sp. SID13666]|uniref:diacylglycerol kinase family protein n=1 Tax=unclassified Streptomyces TaxID=2593676 RepID=UPI0013C0BF71|nr:MULTISPECIES: diacylglycerol kinase family protein [unclassified Streptomyces]NEA58754.1 phosphatase PAP2 family protein [Streptomyces sp. SID13666]NEA70105.1 phosphatase PAP2 family protein [Streptomyces sp. SID13588]
MRPSDEVAARRIGVLLVMQGALLTGFGLLLTRWLVKVPPFTAEDGINRAFAAHRSAGWNSATYWLSQLGNTHAVVLMTAVSVALLLLPVYGRLQREALFLGAAVALQSLVFLMVTAVIDRARPDVAHLDAAPPTSSFPSGHTGAATALYGGLAVLVLIRFRGNWRFVPAAVLFSVPVLVAVARLYRGMHHPTDVLFGLLNGAGILLIMGRSLLPARARPQVPGQAEHTTSAGATAVTRYGRRAAVVVNPTVVDDALHDAIRRTLGRYGFQDVSWHGTTEDDPGNGAVRRAALRKPDLIVVCGGDGTVMACADGLAHSGIPTAVLPCGTGNLLARNLGYPVDPLAALVAALEGTTHAIDLGTADGDGISGARFAAMAGAGFDAAVVGDASSRMKAGIGWAAYLVSGVRHLRDPGMRLTLRLDDGPELGRRARMVLVGNVGTLQGGVPLLPDARPDDGVFDVVLLNPAGPLGWLRAAAHVLSRPHHDRTPRPPGGGGRFADGALEYFTARRIEMTFERPQERELDGEPVGPGVRLVIEVDPGALLMQLPATSPTASSSAPAGTEEPAALTGVHDGYGNARSADPRHHGRRTLGR